MLSPDTISRIVDRLAPQFLSESDRVPLLTEAFGTTPILQAINFSYDARTFVLNLIKVLERINIPPTTPALCTLLLHVRERVGVDHSAPIDALITQIHSDLVERPSSTDQYAAENKRTLSQIVSGGFGLTGTALTLLISGFAVLAILPELAAGTVGPAAAGFLAGIGGNLISSAVDKVRGKHQKGDVFVQADVDELLVAFEKSGLGKRLAEVEFSKQIGSLIDAQKLLTDLVILVPGQTARLVIEALKSQLNLLNEHTLHKIQGCVREHFKDVDDQFDTLILLLSGIDDQLKGMEERLTEEIRQRPLHSCPQAPAPPVNFTGRLSELKDILAQLTRSEVLTVAAVGGTGGMGKTALARALCHLPDSPFKSVVWSEITENPNSAQTLLTWGRYAKDTFSLPRETPIEQTADLVRAMLTDLILNKCGEPVLVVFDDVWDNEACYQAVEILKRAMPPHAQILLTTRFDQVVQRLQGKLVQLDGLSNVDAKGLLRKLITHPKATDSHIERAVKLLEGHPLALELAAASLNLAEDADHLEDILSDYAQGIEYGTPFDAMRLDAQSPRSLNVVFGRSYNGLSDLLKQQFRALGILAPDSTWDRALMGAVWQIEDEKQVREIHRALRTRSLIAQTEGIEGKYQQHRLLRAYARTLAGEKGETEKLFVRYAEWVTAQAAQFDENPPEAWGAFEPFLAPHVLEVGDRLVEQYSHITLPDKPLSKQALDFALRIDGYLANRREVRRPQWLEMGLSAARLTQDQKREALFLNNLGLAWSALGEKRKALEYYEQALPLFRAVGDRSGEAATLNNMGLAWSALGEQRKALEYYEQALPLSRAVGDRSGEATTLINMGLAWDALGEKRKALEYYEQALPLSRAVGDRSGEATTLTNMGGAWSALGEKRKALEYYEQALPLFRAAGDRSGEATTLNNMGGAWDALGEKRKALEYYEQALPLRRAVGDRRGEATTLTNMGLAWDALGEQRKALEYYEQALPLFRAVGDRRGEATTLNNMGGAWDALGEKRKALEYYEQALPLFRAVGDRRGEATTLNNIGSAWDALGEKRKALEYYERALPLFRAVGDRSGEAYILTNMGLAWFDLGEKRKALEYYEQALPLRRAVGDRRGEATTLTNMGLAWDALGEKRKALEYYEQALPLFRAVGDRRGEAYTLHNMSFIHEASGDLEEAIHCAARATELLETIEDVNADASRQNLERLKRKRDGEGSDNDPNALLQQLYNAFMAVQSSDQMAGFVAQLPTEMLEVLEQIVEGVIAQYPPDQTEGVRQRLDDLRRLRGK